MTNFDMILGMDWLVKYRETIDCLWVDKVIVKIGVYVAYND